jgi:hypothetical protein
LLLRAAANTEGVFVVSIVVGASIIFIGTGIYDVLNAL